MAKRYAKFEELRQLLDNARRSQITWKPGGTLGNHHAVVTGHLSHINVEGISSRGESCGTIRLDPGDTLGYNCGSVWRVPRPESYNDPIRRVLALAKISQRLLKYSDESVEYSGGWGRALPGSAADVSTGDDPPKVLGEHVDEMIDHWSDPDQGEYLGGHGWRRRVTGGDAILIRSVSSYEPTTLARRRKVSRVVVRHHAEKGHVAAWLEEILDVGAARERRLAAVAEAARQWEEDAEVASKLWAEILAHYDDEGLRSFLVANATFPPREGKPLLAAVESFGHFDRSKWRELNELTLLYDGYFVVNGRLCGTNGYWRRAEVEVLRQAGRYGSNLVSSYEQDGLVALLRTGRLRAWHAKVNS